MIRRLILFALLGSLITPTAQAHDYWQPITESRVRQGLSFVIVISSLLWLAQHRRMSKAKSRMYAPTRQKQALKRSLAHLTRQHTRTLERLRTLIDEQYAKSMYLPLEEKKAAQENIKAIKQQYAEKRELFNTRSDVTQINEKMFEMDHTIKRERIRKDSADTWAQIFGWVAFLSATATLAPSCAPSFSDRKQ